MVNLYQNDFCGSLELEDRITSGRKPLSTYTPDSTLQGELEKSWIILENKRYLVKGNRDYLSAESINEVFASYLHQKQGYDNYSGYTLLKIKGIFYPEEYLVKNLGLSLTDYYWIRPIDSGLTKEQHMIMAVVQKHLPVNKKSLCLPMQS